MSRKDDKIEHVKAYLGELQDVRPETFHGYQDTKTRLSCERAFEKVTEALTDLAFIIVRQDKLDMPADDKHVFDILQEEGIITSETATAMKEAKGMRNILAHQYADVDDRVVYEAITEEIVTDANEFLRQVESSNLPPSEPNTL